MKVQDVELLISEQPVQILAVASRTHPPRCHPIELAVRQLGREDRQLPQIGVEEVEMEAVRVGRPGKVQQR